MKVLQVIITGIGKHDSLALSIHIYEVSKNNKLYVFDLFKI